jgi:hypothetical protein
MDIRQFRKKLRRYLKGTSNKAKTAISLNTLSGCAGLPATTDQISLRHVILRERCVEMAFENDRWHNLVLSGKAIEVMNAIVAKLKSQINYLTPSPTASPLMNCCFLFPKPEVDLDSGVVIQNPKLLITSYQDHLLRAVSDLVFTLKHYTYVI